MIEEDGSVKYHQMLKDLKATILKNTVSNDLFISQKLFNQVKLTLASNQNSAYDVVSELLEKFHQRTQKDQQHNIELEELRRVNAKKSTDLVVKDKIIGQYKNIKKDLQLQLDGKKQKISSLEQEISSLIQTQSKQIEKSNQKSKQQLHESDKLLSKSQNQKLVLEKKVTELKLKLSSIQNRLKQTIGSKLPQMKNDLKDIGQNLIIKDDFIKSLKSQLEGKVKQLIVSKDQRNNSVGQVQQNNVARQSADSVSREEKRQLKEKSQKALQPIKTRIQDQQQERRHQIIQNPARQSPIRAAFNPPNLKSKIESQQQENTLHHNRFFIPLQDILKQISNHENLLVQPKLEESQIRLKQERKRSELYKSCIQHLIDYCRGFLSYCPNKKQIEQILSDITNSVESHTNLQSNLEKLNSIRPIPLIQLEEANRAQADHKKFDYQRL